MSIMVSTRKKKVERKLVSLYFRPKLHLCSGPPISLYLSRHPISSISNPPIKSHEKCVSSLWACMSVLFAIALSSRVVDLQTWICHPSRICSFLFVGLDRSENRYEQSPTFPRENKSRCSLSLYSYILLAILLCSPYTQGIVLTLSFCSIVSYYFLYLLPLASISSHSIFWEKLWFNVFGLSMTSFCQIFQDIYRSSHSCTRWI